MSPPPPSPPGAPRRSVSGSVGSTWTSTSQNSVPETSTESSCCRWMAPSWRWPGWWWWWAPIRGTLTLSCLCPLQGLGVLSSSDRSALKRRIKDVQTAAEKERKALDKLEKQKEKQRRKDQEQRRNWEPPLGGSREQSLDFCQSEIQTQWTFCASWKTWNSRQQISRPAGWRILKQSLFIHLQKL